MSRGFTLIELLVVIAIIGMLSSVILGSLNNARSKSSNASIKSNLANARAEAALYYDNRNPQNYNSLCTTALAKFTTAINQIISPSVSVCQTVSGVGGGATNQQGYIYYSPLKTSEVVGGVTYTHWCVDHLGTSKGLTAAPGAVQQCP